MTSIERSEGDRSLAAAVPEALTLRAGSAGAGREEIPAQLEAAAAAAHPYRAPGSPRSREP